MHPIVITKENFQKEVVESPKTVLLDFFAEWCGPCRQIAPHLAELAEEHPEYTIAKVNVDEEPELAEAFSVMSIPTLFVIKDGKVQREAKGALPKARLLALLTEV